MNQETWDRLNEQEREEQVDRSELDSRLTDFHRTQERVEITYSDDSKVRCYVGKSTGWRPIYLEILRCNSTGGGAIFSKSITGIKRLGIYR